MSTWNKWFNDWKISNLSLIWCQFSIMYREIMNHSPKSDNQCPESEKENTETISVNKSNHLSQLHFSLLAISSITISVFDQLHFFQFSLQFWEESMMIVLSFTEFDLLVPGSQFSFSFWFWFADFRFWFTIYMVLNWQIFEEMISDVSPPSVTNGQNLRKVYLSYMKCRKWRMGLFCAYSGLVHEASGLDVLHLSPSYSWDRL